MSAKPTPGPWSVRVDSCKTCRDYGVEGEYAVDPVPDGYHAHFKNKADAELVVAACNACQQINDSNPIRVAESLPPIFTFLSQTARLLKDGEETPEHPDGYDLTDEDAVESLAGLIDEARRLLCLAKGRPDGA